MKGKRTAESKMVFLQNENKETLTAIGEKGYRILLFIFLLFESYEIRTKLLKTSWSSLKSPFFFWNFIESKNVFHVGLCYDVLSESL